MFYTSKKAFGQIKAQLNRTMQRRVLSSSWTCCIILGSIFILHVTCYRPQLFKTRDFEKSISRPPQCYEKKYGKLPIASIIITTVNEKALILEENIKSILYHTPPDLFDSIIVVDDYGSRPVSPAILRFPKVILHRTTEPKGVTGARVVGGDLATGDVLVFLDSHMEVSAGWLEPLLEFLVDHPYGISASIIDGLEVPDKWLSNTALSVVTLLYKILDFKWTTSLSTSDISAEPLQSPVLLGSAFAITNTWWAMGKYDPGLIVWGIENIEIAVRTWTCGDIVVFHPCSHVGHYYVRDPDPDPRPRPANFMSKNGVRFADVWMDDFKDPYYKHTGLSEKQIKLITSAPDLEPRRQLRKDLKCKPFAWYLQNVVHRIQRHYNVKPYDAPADWNLDEFAHVYDNYTQQHGHLPPQ